jgi:hypothetical protein
MVAMPMGVNLMAEQTIANVGAKPLRVGQPEQERHVIGHDRGLRGLQERIPVAGTLPGGASCEQALHTVSVTSPNDALANPVEQGAKGRVTGLRCLSDFAAKGWPRLHESPMSHQRR